MNKLFKTIFIVILLSFSFGISATTHAASEEHAGSLNPKGDVNSEQEARTNYRTDFLYCDITNYSISPNGDSKTDPLNPHIDGSIDFDGDTWYRDRDTLYKNGDQPKVHIQLTADKCKGLNIYIAVHSLVVSAGPLGNPLALIWGPIKVDSDHRVFDLYAQAGAMQGIFANRNCLKEVWGVWDCKFDVQVLAANYQFSSTHTSLVIYEPGVLGEPNYPSLNYDCNGSFADIECKDVPWKKITQDSQLSSDTIIPLDPSNPNGSTITYTYLQPLPNPEGGGSLKTFDTSDTSSFGHYVTIIVEFIIGISAVLAVLMIIIGGIQYMTSELISNKEEAKSHMTGAILGLLIVLATVVILQTINPDILNLNLQKSFPPDSVLDTGGDTPPPPANDNNKTMVCKNPSYESGSTWFDDSSTRQQIIALLKDPNIINKSNCATVGQSNCTSVYNLDYSGFAALITKGNFKAGDLIITGGTECWLHQTHKPGTGIMDLSVTPALKAYVEKGLLTQKDWDGGKAPMYTVGTTQFIYETKGGPHYHVRRW